MTPVTSASLPLKTFTCKPSGSWVFPVLLAWHPAINASLSFAAIFMSVLGFAVPGRQTQVQFDNRMTQLGLWVLTTKDQVGRNEDLLGDASKHQSGIPAAPH